MVRMECAVSTEIDGGPVMFHEEVTTVTGNRVKRTIKGMGSGCVSPEPVIRTSAEVADYEREIAEKRRISAYRNRVIRPIFKTDKQRADARKRRRVNPNATHIEN